MDDPANGTVDTAPVGSGTPGVRASPRPAINGDLSRRVLETLGSCLDETDLLHQLHSVVGDWVPHDAGVVARYHDGAAPHLDVTSQRGFDGRPLARKLPLLDLIDPYDINAGPLRIHDLQNTSQRLAQVFAQHQMRSLLFLPLGYDTQISAVVVLAARTPGAFADISDAAIEEFQRLIAIPLRNAGCFATAQQESADTLRLAQHLYTVLETERPAADAVPALLWLAMEQAGADAGSVMALDPATGSLYTRAAQGFHGHYHSAAQLPWGPGLIGALPGMRGSLVFDDLSTAAAQPFGAFVAAEALGAYHGLPLRQGEQLSGLLNLYWRQPRPAADAETPRVDLVAQALALALAQERLDADAAATAALQSQFHQHKDDLLGLMAHQLRTPITTIKGFAQLLLRRHQDVPGNPTTRYAEKVVLEANRLAVMVNNVLDISRLEQALVDTVQRPFDMVALLRAVQHDPQVQALGADHLLRWRLLGGPLLVAGDSASLTQAILALLQRAAVCAPAKHPLHIALHIAPGTQGPPTRRITLAVAGGEPPDPRLHLDDLLNHLDLRTIDNQDASQHSELSLYIALQLLRAQNAELTIEPDAPNTIRYVAHFYPLEAV